MDLPDRALTKRSKAGLFEAAAGGTLFLDEIDSLALPLQSKLLTAIEGKRIRRLGAVVEHPVDVQADRRDPARPGAARRGRAVWGRAPTP